MFCIGIGMYYTVLSCPVETVGNSLFFPLRVWIFWDEGVVRFEMEGEERK